MFKLEEIEFNEQGFHKLKNIKIQIAPRLTAIAGHNGIGKSTILGLIAHCSGLKVGENSFFNRKFQSNFQEAFYLDYNDDFAKFETTKKRKKERKIILSYKYNDNLTIRKFYSFNKQTHSIPQKLYKSYMVKVPNSQNTSSKKSISLSRVSIYRLRIIPRTIDSKNIIKYGNENPNIISQNMVRMLKGSAKIPIPTLYLGMSRMTPIGEFDITSIDKTIKQMDNDDKLFIQRSFNQVLPTFYDEDNITTHIFSGSIKSSCLPSFNYNSFAISLGQDSLSSIITALASFNRLKRLQGIHYQGGILVIDEVDAGLHPRAQQKLIDLLHSEAKNLKLQIIFTTHSLTVLQCILDKNAHEGCKVNGVVYLKDSNYPSLMENPTYTKIKNDMLVLPPDNSETEIIKIYFEDEEAVYFFEQILKFKKIENNKVYFGKEIKTIPLSVGCNILMKLHEGDEYFQSVVIIPDNDINTSLSKRKSIESDELICPLPGNKDFNENTSSKERSPESIIYKFLYDKVHSETNEALENFWKKMPSGYTSDYVSDRVLTCNEYETNGKFDIPREKQKSWFKQNKNFFNNANIILLWCQENESEVELFLKKLALAIDLASKAKV